MSRFRDLPSPRLRRGGAGVGRTCKASGHSGNAPPPGPPLRSDHPPRRFARGGNALRRHSKFPHLFAGLLTALLLTLPAFAQKTGLGRPALPEEIAAWDIDIRPDGQGLPPGSGSVKAGEALYLERCASCHGEFGEGVGRWPVIAGGQGSLKNDGPEKTVGSFWPYASTSFDYIRRAMPYGNARSLSDDEAYAITAFLLNMNGVVKEDFTLSKENFSQVRLPNEAAFLDDDRETAERHFWNKAPCMKDCKADARVTNRARIIDVTPEDGKKLRVE